MGMFLVTLVGTDPAESVQLFDSREAAEAHALKVLNHGFRTEILDLDDPANWEEEFTGSEPVPFTGDIPF